MTTVRVSAPSAVAGSAASMDHCRQTVNWQSKFTSFFTLCYERLLPWPWDDRALALAVAVIEAVAMTVLWSVMAVTC